MISIVTITYNRAHLLSKAIESVLHQSHQDFEYVIIDDGSIDNTADLVKSYNDKRIRYYSTIHSGRLAVLRNRGIKLSYGVVVTFLDADDFYEPDYLAFLHQKFQNLDLRFLASQGKETGPYASPEKWFKLSTSPQTPEAWLKAGILDKTLQFHPSCFAFRAQAFQQRYNENLDIGNDDFFWRVMSLHQGELAFEQYVNILKHEDNYSKASKYLNNLLPEQIYSIRYLYRKGRLNPKIYTEASITYYERLVELHKSKKDFAAAAKVSVGLISLKPGKLKFWFQTFGLTVKSMTRN